MPDSIKLLDYQGEVDHKKIDQLLKRLKKSDSYLALDKTTAKRVYAILVECLENISKHCENSIKAAKACKPYVLVTRTKTKVMIKTGNTVFESKAMELSNRLDKINQVDDAELNRLYDDMINKKTGRNENGAGLGFMLMKFKSGNPIEYSVHKTDGKLLLFEFRIKINKYIMRKLIIEPTVSSPKVILDPDKNWFEISGESRPSDVATFYEEIISWMDDYSRHLVKSADIMEPLTFNLDFEYFNSSSAKYILDFCKQIGDVKAIGKHVQVRWLYDEDDMDMLEVGREMSRMAKCPFDYIPKEIK